MNTAPKLQVVDNELAGEVDRERPPLIGEGEYEAVLAKRVLRHVNSAKKLELRFRITSFGKAFGKTIPCFYNVKSISIKKGTFRVGWKSRYVREYARLFPVPSNLKRFSTAPLKGRIVRLRVKTVTHDSRQQAIPDDLRYSVVAELLELVE